MKPLIGLIGGTGLGHALAHEIKGDAIAVETPYGPPSGSIARGTWQGIDVAFLPRHGPQHTLPPSAVPYRANIFALKSIGVTHILASGATGSLREELRPRDLVIPDQVIDKTHRRVGTFFDEAGLAAHVEFSQPFCPMLRRVLLDSSSGVDVTLHDAATYVCMEGPAFSTVAESRMHRSWGGDLIGMTCMPEAKLAREAEICYALIALPTDYDCWRPHDPGVSQHELLKEIIGNVEHATANSVQLLKTALEAIRAKPLTACNCQKSLDLAIWTKPAGMDADIKKKLNPILARYCSKQ
ncbi:MAG: S-methyl-5'-thioadenosine phosphorylase [Planctomycetes bacterium]|nr:S-methyl-5'-thioadenosine phosphorylase [Planctomycetota bacterium]